MSILQFEYAYSGVIGSEYATGKDKFFKMCEVAYQKSQENDFVYSNCFIYFMGIRDGYLTSFYDSLDRVVLYYSYRVEMSPGSELNFKYALKFDEACDSPAYKALFEHAVLCIR